MWSSVGSMVATSRRRASSRRIWSAVLISGISIRAGSAFSVGADAGTGTFAFSDSSQYQFVRGAYGLTSPAQQFQIDG